MNPTHQTAAGTAVFEPTQAEYDAFVERAVQERVGMAPGEFIEKFAAGELDDSDPAVVEVASLLQLGQNGYRLRS